MAVWSFGHLVATGMIPLSRQPCNLIISFLRVQQVFGARQGTLVWIDRHSLLITHCYPNDDSIVALSLLLSVISVGSS